MLDNNYVIIVNTDTWNGVLIENYEKVTFLRRGSPIHVNSKARDFKSCSKARVNILDRRPVKILG